MSRPGPAEGPARQSALDAGAAGAGYPGPDREGEGADPPAAPPARIVVGVISDTHGHLYPEVIERLRGVDHIIHAGDIGSPEVLKALKAIAPVTAVRGNVDVGGWADPLPSRAEVELGGVCIVVGHISPRADGAGLVRQPVVVVAGHSHIADRQMRGDVLHLNPGSAGPRRFGRPRTLMRMEILPPRDAGAGSGAAIPRVNAEIVAVEG